MAREAPIIRLSDTEEQQLRKLAKQVRELDRQVDGKYAEWQRLQSKAPKERAFAAFQKLDRKLQNVFPKFCDQPLAADR